MGDGDPVIDRDANMEEDGSIPRAIDGARLCQRHHKRSFDYSEYGRTGLSGGGNALVAAVTMLSAEDESYVQKRVHQLEENCRIALETSQSKVHRVDALFANIAPMVSSIFAVVQPKVIRIQVHGCAQYTICSVLVMLIDEHLPYATVHIERMQGQNVVRVLQANTVLFELDGDDQYCFFEDLMQSIHMECGRVCPRATSILVALRDGEECPQARTKPRYTIKVFTLAGRLLTRFDMLFAATVRDLLQVVQEDCVCHGHILD